MRAAYTAPRRTPMSFGEATTLAKWALTHALGKPPSVAVLALFLAKTALETGRWTAIWNGNWGNWKATETWDEMFTCITLNEVLVRNGRNTLVWFAPEGELSAAPSKGGKLIEAPIPVPDGHPQTRMRAFPGNTHGVEVYVDSLERGRYREAWGFLLQGDPVAYVHSLKAKGYFTADESLYRSGVVALMRQFEAKLRSEAPPHPVDLEWARLKALVPQLQFNVDELLGNDFEEAVA